MNAKTPPHCGRWRGRYRRRALVFDLQWRQQHVSAPVDEQHIAPVRLRLASTRRRASPILIKTMSDQKQIQVHLPDGSIKQFAAGSDCARCRYVDFAAAGGGGCCGAVKPVNVPLLTLHLSHAGR